MLVEIIAVLIIIGIIAAVAVPRYINLQANAKRRAIDAAIAELNGRESLTWANQKISVGGYPGDALTFSQVNTDLGEDVWEWDPKLFNPLASGGTLRFKGELVTLSRSPSTTNRPAVWSRP